MKNKTLYFFFLVGLSACSIAQKVETSNLDLEKFNQVKLGQSKEEVIANLGSASSIETTVRPERRTEGWIYCDHDEISSQVGAVSFEILAQRVVSKTVIPRNGDKEKNLDYLISGKFSTAKFERVPMQVCHRDFLPAQVFYISASEGIVIEFDTRSKAVESITWSSPEDAANEMKKIKNCLK